MAEIFWATSRPIKDMCEAAPGIIDLLDRMGVPFNRTPEGLLDFRRFGGTLYNRTAFAGATTGQQLALCAGRTSPALRIRRQGQEVRALGISFGGARWEPRLPRHLRDGFALDGSAHVPCRRDHHCDRRQSARSSASRRIRWCVRGRRSRRFISRALTTRTASSFRFIPTCIPGEDKLRLMSESARGEGGRVWVPKTAGDNRDPKSIPESERWYFLEEWYPKYGNLVPRDVATRAIFKVVFEYNLGIDGKPMVYLDLTHIDRKILDKKLEGILEIYEKFVGDDPRDTPMKIFPGMHYTMGGLWVDFKQATNIPGVFAAGECEYQYHGANRLGANSLVSCIYGGGIAGPNAVNYARGLQALPDGNGCFDAEKKKQEEQQCPADEQSRARRIRSSCGANWAS